MLKNSYGPYSDKLRHALNRLEGHVIGGLADGVGVAKVEPAADALAEADEFLAEGTHADLVQRVERVARLIDGLLSPYGMELLATAHWVITYEQTGPEFEQVLSAVHAWNTRKAKIIQPAHVRAAMARLVEQKWMKR